MVPFTTDPRIAYARARQQAGMKQAMTPYQLPRNPYGGSPVAGNLQRLADALGARWAGADAARLQEGQKTAQSQILANLLRGQTGVPGSEQYARGQIQVPTQDVQVTGEYRPIPTGGDWQRLTIDDTGATVIDPAVLKTAGLSPGEYSILERKAKLEGAKISEANRIAFATQKLGEATTQDERKYWLGQIDAAEAAGREMDVAEAKDAEERSLKTKMRWAINNKGKSVAVSDWELSRNPDDYSKIPTPVDQGRIPEFSHKAYSELSDKYDLVMINLNNNRLAQELVTSGTLTTGSLTPILTKFKGLLQAVGFEVGKELSAGQVLDSMSKKKALAVRNPKSGLGLTGNTSDRDLRFLEAAVIGLAKTNHANEALLIIDTAHERRKRQILELKMDYISNNPHKGLIGFDSTAANEGLKKVALFTQKEETRLKFLLEDVTKIDASDGDELPTTSDTGFVATDLRGGN